MASISQSSSAPHIIIQDYTSSYNPYDLNRPDNDIVSAAMCCMSSIAIFVEMVGIGIYAFFYSYNQKTVRKFIQGKYQEQTV